MKSFALQQFHDEFVRHGGIPIESPRILLLPCDIGSTLQLVRQWTSRRNRLRSDRAISDALGVQCG